MSNLKPKIEIGEDGTKLFVNPLYDYDKRPILIQECGFDYVVTALSACSGGFVCVYKVDEKTKECDLIGASKYYSDFGSYAYESKARSIIKSSIEYSVNKN